MEWNGIEWNGMELNGTTGNQNELMRIQLVYVLNGVFTFTYMAVFQVS